MGNLVFQATLGGQVNLVGPNTASTYNLNVPAIAGTLVTTGDTGTVTNTMLAGSIANAKLTNSSVTIGSTSVSLGATASTITGLTLTNPTINGFTGDTSVINVGSGQLYKDTSGNFGVGTTSPSTYGQLAVVSSSTNSTSLNAINTSTSGGSLLVLNCGNGTTSAQYNYISFVNNQTTSQTWRFGNYGGNNLTWQNVTAGTAAMTLDTSGNLLVGLTSTSTAAEGGYISNVGVLFSRRSGTGSNTHAVFQNNASVTPTSVGSITTNLATTAYNTSSDYRLKHDIQPMTGALAKVAALKPVTYKWNADGSDGQGFIAHELAEVCPDAVHGAKDATEMQQYEISPAVPATYDEQGNELTPAVEAVMGEREVPVYQGIDTSFLVATLTAAIQELETRLAALENK